MREIRGVRQVPGESKRRWFASNQFDLIVWFGEDDMPIGFELCYDKQHAEHALAWRRGSGLRHLAVDDGEGRAGKHKASPILELDGRFDAVRLHAAFNAASRGLPEEIAALVLEALEQHPNFPRAA